jgi:hypothetical protein
MGPVYWPTDLKDTSGQMWKYTRISERISDPTKPQTESGIRVKPLHRRSIRVPVVCGGTVRSHQGYQTKVPPTTSKHNISGSSQRKPQNGAERKGENPGSQRSPCVRKHSLAAMRIIKAENAEENRPVGCYFFSWICMNHDDAGGNTLRYRCCGDSRFVR